MVHHLLMLVFQLQANTAPISTIWINNKDFFFHLRMMKTIKNYFMHLMNMDFVKLNLEINESYYHYLLGVLLNNLDTSISPKQSLVCKGGSGEERDPIRYKKWYLDNDLRNSKTKMKKNYLKIAEARGIKKSFRNNSI